MGNWSVIQKKIPKINTLNFFSGDYKLGREDKSFENLDKESKVKIIEGVLSNIFTEKDKYLVHNRGKSSIAVAGRTKKSNQKANKWSQGSSQTPYINEITPKKMKFKKISISGSTYIRKVFMKSSLGHSSIK